MYSLIERPFEKRFMLALVLVAFVAVQFWTQSRYPSLNEKAMMSGAIQLEDPLSFEAHYEIRAEYPVWKKIGLSTLNWVHTNERGMTFGVLFGGAFLTLLGYMRRRSFKSRFANSLAGMGFGAPLGVCVNCAAPIAKALYSGGARAESVLSAMIASPTLNVVVLTMLFSLMPAYMAFTKIALSIVVILVAVPIICRFLPERQLQVDASLRQASKIPVPMLPYAEVETLPRAVWYFVLDFLRNLWFIISRTVPLMFLAGFLGAVIATLLPPSLLAQAPFGIIAVVIAALVGTFLPVPIGFDVVVSGALLGSGLDTGFVMTLLFTLGIFSIYSWFIVAGAISLRAASLLGAVIIAIGVFAGIGIHYYHAYKTRQAIEILTGFELSLVSSAHAAEADTLSASDDYGNEVMVTRRPFAARSPAGETPFTRMEAWKIGIDQPIEFSMADMWPPFWEGRSLSAGDIDGDGDSDLVVASTVKGLYFYLNDGTGKFTATRFPIGKLAEMPIFNAVLVDIDNDGWLDLFLTSYHQGNHILRNLGGRFDVANLEPVANRDDAVLTLAASFGDVDRDGDLDVALGNWAAGWYRRVPGEESRNRIIFNDNGTLDGSNFRELPGLPGETLTMLISDIDVDGDADLLVGNDFEIPDMFYRGDGKGGFELIRRTDGVIPATTTTTMSVKTADLHNDGSPEIYLAQIAGRSSGVSKKLKMRPLEFYCDGIEREVDRAVCEKNMQIKTWYKSGNNFDPTFASECEKLDGAYRDECKGMLVKDLAIQNNDPSLCELIPAGQVKPRQFCDIHFRPFRAPTEAELEENIHQIKRRNVLLSRKVDGTYEDLAQAQGLEVGGWSWDVKVADLDNDGWQDIYIVNGTWVPNEVSPSNLFFHNNGDGTFSEQSGAFGLEDYLITAAATTIDIENDGDLDVITMPVNGPAKVFVNNAASGNSIGFEFRDRIGNHFGVGNRIEIASGGGTQMRELQTGGGFMSFDAPVAYFGLGDAQSIDSATIHWANGGTTRIEGGLTAGAVYRVERHARPESQSN
ncbi:MAG: FG-GAP-like repeat-containing protein [Rhizobiaceae bacterium]